jgi:type IV pilus assembly protein PilV
MQQLTARSQTKGRMEGWGLTEALIALGVLSLGVLGLLWQQGKTAVAWRSQHMAEQAAWLAQDLAERMRANRGQLEAYRLGWGQVPHAVDCSARPCSLSDWASSDLWGWTREVQIRLPGAQTQVWLSPSDAQHIGIALAWRDPDKSPQGAASDPPGLNCPPQHRCFGVLVRP